jgi:hypothetical protein
MSKFTSKAVEGRGPTLLKQWLVTFCSTAKAVQTLLVVSMRVHMARSVVSALGQGLQHGVV